MGYCEECGKPLKEGMTFCEFCGTPVPQDQASLATEDSDAQTPPVFNEVIPQERSEFSDPTDMTPSTGDEKESSESQPRKKKKRGPILIGLVVVLLLGGGGGHWWLSHRPSQEEVQSTTHQTSVSSDSPTVETETLTSTTIESTIASSSEEATTPFPAAAISQLADQTVGNITGTTGIYVSQMGTDEAYSQNGTLPIRAASVIKLFLMTAFYQEVAEGSILLNEPYVLKDYDKVGGTGVLQTYAEGTTFTYETLVRHMIVDSDNTAGNIILTILGGPENVTRLIQEMGYTQTRVERRFVDTEALDSGKDNYTAASDVGLLLKTLYQNQAISVAYDEQMLDILRANTNHTKLPNQVPETVTIYNKTGEYGDYGVQNDACIFEMSAGVAYVVVVLSQDGNEAEQVSSMQEFGEDLYDTLGGEVE